MHPDDDLPGERLSVISIRYRIASWVMRHRHAMGKTFRDTTVEGNLTERSTARTRSTMRRESRLWTAHIPIGRGRMFMYSMSKPDGCRV
jgi:hypothetical protein